MLQLLRESYLFTYFHHVLYTLSHSTAEWTKAKLNKQDCPIFETAARGLEWEPDVLNTVLSLSASKLVTSVSWTIYVQLFDEFTFIKRKLGSYRIFCHLTLEYILSATRQD